MYPYKTHLAVNRMGAKWQMAVARGFILVGFLRTDIGKRHVPNRVRLGFVSVEETLSFQAHTMFHLAAATLALVKVYYQNN